MNKKLIILDILCYAVIPFLLWNYGREPLGDYLAILLSTVPGFIYTVYRFVTEKQLNIAGLFIITSLFISTVVDLVSTSAIHMLWNQIYLGFGFAVVFLITTFIKSPLALYFAVDFAYLQGYQREESKNLFKTKGLFGWFQFINGVFIFRAIALNWLKASLLQLYGAEGYNQVIMYMNVSDWIFNGIIFLAYIFVSNKIMKFTTA